MYARHPLIVIDACAKYGKPNEKNSYGLQARRQEFPEGGSSTRIASRAPRDRGSGGLERPTEAQEYLEQNPSI